MVLCIAVFVWFVVGSVVCYGQCAAGQMSDYGLWAGFSSLGLGTGVPRSIVSGFCGSRMKIRGRSGLLFRPVYSHRNQHSRRSSEVCRRRDRYAGSYALSISEGGMWIPFLL